MIEERKSESNKPEYKRLNKETQSIVERQKRIGLAESVLTLKKGAIHLLRNSPKNPKSQNNEGPPLIRAEVRNALRKTQTGKH